jgi:hypothetical protein
MAQTARKSPAMTTIEKLLDAHSRYSGDPRAILLACAEVLDEMEARIVATCKADAKFRTDNVRAQGYQPPTMVHNDR